MRIENARLGVFNQRGPDGRPIVITYNIGNADVENFPATVGPFLLEYAVLFDQEDASKTLTISVKMIDDDGKRLFEAVMTINNGPDVGPAGMPYLQYMEVNNVKIPKAGDYEFDIRIDGCPVTAIPLRMRQSKPEA